MVALDTLAEQLGVNERTLRRAVSDGAIHATRRSPRTLEVTLAELHYARRSWPLISSLRGALRTERNVRFALLFGSAARGTDTPASDVDLIVKLVDPILDRVVDLEAKLTGITGRRVDITRLQDAQAEPWFLADAVADGRVLIDRDGTGEALRRSRASLDQRARQQQAERLQAVLPDRDLSPTR